MGDGNACLGHPSFNRRFPRYAFPSSLNPSPTQNPPNGARVDPGSLYTHLINCFSLVLSPFPAFAVRPTRCALGHNVQHHYDSCHSSPLGAHFMPLLLGGFPYDVLWGWGKRVRISVNECPRKGGETLVRSSRKNNSTVRSTIQTARINHVLACLTTTITNLLDSLRMRLHSDNDIAAGKLLGQTLCSP